MRKTWVGWLIIIAAVASLLNGLWFLGLVCIVALVLMPPKYDPAIKLKERMTEARLTNTERFMRDNELSPVVYGSAIGDGGEGMYLRLEDGCSYTLSQNELKSLPKGYPIWKIG